MAFLAALPEIAASAGEAGAAAGEAGAAGAEAGGAAEGGSKLFSPKAGPTSGDQGKQQNVGASRTDNFMDAAMAARNALRPSAGGVD